MGFSIFDLTLVEWVQASLTVSLVIISFICGSIIMSRYRKYQVRALLFVGLTWIGIMSPYWGYVVNFFYIMIVQESLPEATILLIAMCIFATFHVTWMWAFTEFFFNCNAAEDFARSCSDTADTANANL